MRKNGQKKTKLSEKLENENKKNKKTKKKQNYLRPIHSLVTSYGVQMFQKGDSPNKNTNDCSFQQVLRQNLSWFLS